MSSLNNLNVSQIVWLENIEDSQIRWLRDLKGFKILCLQNVAHIVEEHEASGWEDLGFANPMVKTHLRSF